MCWRQTGRRRRRGNWPAASAALPGTAFLTGLQVLNRQAKVAGTNVFWLLQY
jgi:hypothetical protein